MSIASRKLRADVVADREAKAKAAKSAQTKAAKPKKTKKAKAEGAEV